MKDILIKKLINKNFEIVNDNYDIAISIGGDGTFLKMVHESNFNNNVYYIGINTGTLGFLEEFNYDELDDFINDLISNNFKIEEVSIMKTSIITKDNKFDLNSLNEIVIRNNELNVLKSNIYIDNELLEKFIGDGVIISTPTGSTGYNSSCKGPIIYNGLNVLSLTPIAPINNKVYDVISNSLIVPSDKNITFDIKDKDLIIINDGKYDNYKNVERIDINLSSNKIKCLRVLDYNYIKVINSKLLK